MKELSSFIGGYPIRAIVISGSRRRVRGVKRHVGCPIEDIVPA